MQHVEKRFATSISDAVDEAIEMHESGEVELAMRLLSALGFPATTVSRLLLSPDKRRQYIATLPE